MTEHNVLTVCCRSEITSYETGLNTKRTKLCLGLMTWSSNEVLIFINTGPKQSQEKTQHAFTTSSFLVFTCSFGIRNNKETKIRCYNFKDKSAIAAPSSDADFCPIRGLRIGCLASATETIDSVRFAVRSSKDL